MPEKFDTGFLHEDGPRFGRLRYGKYKWDNYLIDISRGQVESTKYLGRAIENAQVNATNALGEGHSSDFARLSSALGDSMEQQSDRFAKTINEVVTDLRGELQSNAERAMNAFDGFTGQLEEQTDRIVDQIDILAQILYSGFNILEESIEMQIDLSRQILAKLENIKELLNNPTVTQAQELIRLGEMHLTQKLETEALALLKRSEALYSINPALHLHLGQIYFSCAKHLDREEAKKHFRFAVRYADATRANLGELVWIRTRDRAFRGLASIAFTESSDAKFQDNNELASKLLNDTIELTSHTPQSCQTGYLRATAFLLSGKRNEAKETLKKIVDRFPQFVIDALSDTSFSGFQDELAKLPDALHSDADSLTSKLKNCMKLADNLIEDYINFENRQKCNLGEAMSTSDMSAFVREQHNHIRDPKVCREDIREYLESMVQKFYESITGAAEYLATHISERRSQLQEPHKPTEAVLDISAFSKTPETPPQLNSVPFPTDEFTKSMFWLALKGIPVILLINLVVSTLVAFTHDYSTNHMTEWSSTQLGMDPEHWGLLYPYWPCFWVLVALVFGIRTMWEFSRHSAAQKKMDKSFQESCVSYQQRENQRQENEKNEYVQAVARETKRYTEAMAAYERELHSYNTAISELRWSLEVRSGLLELANIAENLLKELRGGALQLIQNGHKPILLPPDFIL